MAYDGMHNAMTNEANKQPGILRRLGTTGAIIIAACLAGGATFLGYGVDANLPWPVTSNTTIAVKHCQGTILAGTGSTGQFTLTLPAVTGFPSNCSVLIKNGDTTFDKVLSGFPGDLNPILYRSQSVGVKIVNGAWASFYNPGAYLAPAGGITLYASPTGNDTSNSCISSGTPCTLKGACSARAQIATFFSGNFAIALAHGTYSATDPNSALCTVLGNIGGSSAALTSIFGDCASPTAVVLAVPNNSAALYTKDGAEAGLHCVEITGGNNSTGIQNSGQGAVNDYDQITWGSWGTGGGHVSGSWGSYINLNGNGETLTANFAVHWILGGNATLFAGGPTAIPSAISWSGGAFLIASGNNNINLANWSVTGSGVASSTGQRAILFGTGYMITPSSTTPCNSTLPGNSGCTFANGFQDSAGDPTSYAPPSSPWPVPSGGTGNATAAAHSIPVSEGTAAQNVLGPCTTSQVIVGAGASADPVCGGVPAAALPNPSASTLGGIESIAALAHTWIASIDTSGVPHQSQPATADLRDVTTPTAWTAVDGSGAGLSLTTSDTLYTKIGNVCIISFAITYPTTANANTAQVSGIPAACAAKNGTLSWVAGAMALDSGAGIGVVYAALQKNGQSLFFFNSGAQQTNANKSNVTVRGTITYITN